MLLEIFFTLVIILVIGGLFYIIQILTDLLKNTQHQPPATPSPPPVYGKQCQLPLKPKDTRKQPPALPSPTPTVNYKPCLDDLLPLAHLLLLVIPRLLH